VSGNSNRFYIFDLLDWLEVFQSEEWTKLHAWLKEHAADADATVAIEEVITAAKHMWELLDRLENPQVRTMGSPFTAVARVWEGDDSVEQGVEDICEWRRPDALTRVSKDHEPDDAHDSDRSGRTALLRRGLH